MGSIIEVDKSLSVEVKRNTFILIDSISEDTFEFEYSQVAAVSRALSVVKESNFYQRWLQRLGLA